MNARGYDQRGFGAEEIPWQQILRYVPLVLLLLLAAYLCWNSFYTVQPYERAVLLRFGKSYATAPPGLHFKIPLVDQVLVASMEEHSLNLPFGVRGGRPDEPGRSEEETLTLTGDLNAASVEWTVQWKVTVPQDYLFSFHDPADPLYMERVITTAARTVMNRLIGDYSIDEVLTEKRGEIAAEAREATQGILDQYACGVTIVDLQMQRVTPPERVKPAFDRVNASIQKRDQFENEANKERNQLLPGAYAKKDQLIREAEGYAKRRRAEATGEIAALLAKYEAYQNAPEVTRQRLYLEALQEVFQSVETKIIIDGDLRQVLPLLDLQSKGGDE